MRKNDAFVAKIVTTRLTKGFMAIFAPAESLPSPATLGGLITLKTIFPTISMFCLGGALNNSTQLKLGCLRTRGLCEELFVQKKNGAHFHKYCQRKT